MSQPKILKGIMTVGFWTLLSRVLGMAREVLIFALIGAGPVLDAFIAAFRLPNMFRRFFAEGAFNAAFVPMFSKRLEADDRPGEFASQAMGGLATVLLILTGVAMIFMPALVWATAEGFVGNERFDLSVDYGRVMFPYILLISMAALLSGALNASGRFAMAAAAPVFLNILIILALIAAYVLNYDAIWFLVWTVPLAGAVQLGLVWYAAHKAGLNITLARPRWNADMRNLVVVALPAALANGVMQINLLVGQQVSSQFPNAVSWLYGADRLYQLPLGVVGIAVGIVLLPDLSRRLQARDDVGAKAAFSRAGEITFALTIPSAVALCVIPLPLVSALYEHGSTGRSDAEAMALATAIYGLGLPAFVLQKLLQPLYFAREDTRSPFRFAVVSMVINAVFAIGLMPVFGWYAPAIATTVSAWAMILLLAIGARKFGDVARFDNRMKSRLVRVIIASLMMGACLWALQWMFASYVTTTFLRVAFGLGLVGVGSVCFGVFGQLVGAIKISELKSTIRRG